MVPHALLTYGSDPVAGVYLVMTGPISCSSLTTTAPIQIADANGLHEHIRYAHFPMRRDLHLIHADVANSMIQTAAATP